MISALLRDDSSDQALSKNVVIALTQHALDRAMAVGIITNHTTLFPPQSAVSIKLK